MPKVLVPLADGFEETEAIAIVDVLRRADFEVVLAGLHSGRVNSARNVGIMPDDTIDGTNVADFDMIILPGGQPGVDNLNRDDRIKTLLRDFNAEGKPIGAICAAPIILAAAGLLSGVRATCHPTCRDRLGNAIYVDSQVVADGNILTSQGAGTALNFGLAAVARLAGDAPAAAIARAMLVSPPPREQNIWDERLFNNIVQALVGALEVNDSYIQGHARRVSEYTLSIGRKLNLGATELRDLYLGSVLHDIGKIATEEDLLNKPDRLNSREEILIREHPLKGTLFIVGIENLSHIVPTILHHHERWDGLGYPGRLKGEHIPLHARIVGIADSFDAMCSTRSYRPALTKEDAIRELLKQKGTQFDPFIVDVFIECLNESPYEMKDFSYYF